MPAPAQSKGTLIAAGAYGLAFAATVVLPIDFHPPQGIVLAGCLFLGWLACLGAAILTRRNSLGEIALCVLPVALVVAFLVGVYVKLLYGDHGA